MISFLADEHGNGGNVMRNLEHDYLKGLAESRKCLELCNAAFNYCHIQIQKI